MKPAQLVTLTEAERRMLRVVLANMSDMSPQDWRNHGLSAATFERLQAKLLPLLVKSK